MTIWRKALQNNDPAADARLTGAEVASIRGLVVAAARAPRPDGLTWRMPLGVAAAVVLTVAAGVAGGRIAAGREAVAPGQATAPALRVDERRQLQFSTPGGTRIIWEFNTDFTLRETIP